MDGGIGKEGEWNGMEWNGVTALLRSAYLVVAGARL